MNDELYDLVFKGELVAGFELTLVKKNLQQLFRINEQQVESLFSGAAVPLKKRLDADTANKYRVAMKKAGAKINVVQSQAPATKPEPAKATASQAQKPPAPSPDSGTGDGGQFKTDLGAQPSKPASPRQPIAAPDFKIACVGANMIEASEKPLVVSKDVDVSHLAVTPQGGNLVAEEELSGLPILEIDVPNYDVAPAGSEVLKPEERKRVEVVNVDTSGLTVGEVGEKLSPDKAPAPPAPNVDHIKLAE